MAGLIYQDYGLIALQLQLGQVDRAQNTSICKTIQEFGVYGVLK